MAYHGNLQKIRNGKRTFAITPHIPGGFIKPEGLIKIGEVAKKYGGVRKSFWNMYKDSAVKKCQGIENDVKVVLNQEGRYFGRWIIRV